MSARPKTSLLQGPQLSFPTDQAWWQEGRRQAWAQFQALPMPKRKDEDWRFADLRRLTLEPYLHEEEPALADLEPCVEQSQAGFDSAGCAIFADNLLLQHDPLPETLRAQGVIWEPFDRALKLYPELLRQHFMSQPVALGSQKFAALHRAFCRSGMLVYIPDGVRVELPLTAFHWLVGTDRSVFPHTLIVAGRGSEVSVVDFLRSADDRPGFACSVNDLIVGPEARVTYTCIQEWSEQVLSFQINATEVAKGGYGKSLNVHLGGAYARAESQGRLIGAEARSEMLSISVGHGTQNFDQRTLQYHEGPHTWSDLLYKNALSHRSRSVFKGLIQVAPTARFTDAYQTNRNLLLDPEAEADSMPGLEICNDDVKCSHGATTGPVDAEELFYLLSRGIHPVTAKQLIVDGFLAEVTDRLGHEGLAKLIGDRIHAKFVRTRALGSRPDSEMDSPAENLDPTDPSLAVAEKT